MRTTVLVALLLASCSPDKSKSASAPMPQSPSAPLIPAATPADAAVHTTAALPHPEGDDSTRDCDALVRDVPQTELIARYGAPTESSSFVASQGVGEMRIEILNDYPASDPTSAKTKIIEQVWRAGGVNFVVWTHEKAGQWVGLQALSYLDGVEF